MFHSAHYPSKSWSEIGGGKTVNLQLAVGILAMAMMAVPGVVVAQDNTDDSTHTATGCLEKTSTASVYALTDENGKMWDLRSKTVPLGPHVGHTVTVSGTIPKDSKGSGSSGDTAPQNHLLVTNLKMVRDSCKQP
jgi:hypothetical protein